MAPRAQDPMAKPRYPSEREIRDAPNVQYYAFSANMGQDWLAVGRQGNAVGRYQTEHVVEWRWFKEFRDGLESGDLRGGSTRDLYPRSVNKERVLRLLENEYGNWAGGLGDEYRETTAINRIKRAFGSRQNVGVLCFLENEVNTMKENICGMKRPVANVQFTRWLSFDDYANVDNIEEKLCTVACVFAYITQPDVQNKLEKVAKDVEKELQTFQQVYRQTYNEEWNLAALWKSFFEAQMAKMTDDTEEWLDTKFIDLVNEGRGWRLANPGEAQQIQLRVHQLKAVRRHALEVVSRARKIYLWRERKPPERYGFPSTSTQALTTGA